MVGLPGGKGWERHYHCHSPFLNEIVIDLADKMTKRSLIREIDTRISEKLKALKYTEEEARSAIKVWHEKDLTNIPHHILKLGLAISFDIGWQKRSTEKLYDSLSGHGLLYWRNYRLVCKMLKKCIICRNANKHGMPAHKHKCTINWTGTSGAMESGVALGMVKKLFEDYEGRLFIEYIVSDDDSSMRSHLRHIDDGGKLPPNVPQPTFLADPSHRIKTMCSPIYKMITDTKDPSKCKKIDFYE